MDLHLQQINVFLCLSVSTGTLRLKVPWKNLKSERIEIHVQNVTILLAATPPLTPSEGRRAPAIATTHSLSPLFSPLTLRSVITRRSQLRCLPPPPPKWTPKEKKEEKRGYLMKVLETVVDNVHVTISNLRVRYEDCVGSAPHCAFDFSISHVEVATTDDSGVPLFAQLQNIVYAHQPLHHHWFVVSI